MEGVLNREKSEKAKRHREGMKRYWAKWRAAKAARVETGVAEEPRSEPEPLRPMVVDVVVCVRVAAGRECGRCGHGLGVHDFRGCQAGGCRCGAFR
jgi:hypothetical protein